MTRPETPLQSLSIYLLKKVDNPHEALNTRRVRKLDIDENHVIYIRRNVSKLPTWAKFFAGNVAAENFGETTSAGALLFCAVEDRHFAVTFGTGRHLLDPTAIETRFGLLVTLNSVDPAKVKSIDTASLDRPGFQSRIQAGRDASASDFGLDIERDLVRAVAGIPSEAEVGETIAGYDALHVNTRTTFAQLRSLLKKYLKAAEGKRYKKAFGWIDQVQEIRDDSLVQSLNDELVAHLKEDSPSVWIAPAGIIDWNDVSSFQFGHGHSKPRFPTLTLERLFEFLGGRPNVSVDRLESTRVFALRADDTQAHEWPVMRCVQAEIKLGDATYLLSNGKWYRIDDDFVKSVNAAVKSIDVADLGLPEFEDESEGKFNERAAKASAGKLVDLDAKNIQYGGGASKIEFCDLYSDKGDMLHMKRYSGSSVLSHLFSQGAVSAETFKADMKFRQLVNENLPDSHKLKDPDRQPDVGKMRVVFGIIGGPTSAEELPFFARVTLKNASRSLQAFGYKVALTFVPLEERFAKLSSFRAKRVRRRPPSSGANPRPAVGNVVRIGR